MNQLKLNKKITEILIAIDENYAMVNQYKYACNTLKQFNQFQNEQISSNLHNFITWMEENFAREKFYEVLGKSYDLHHNILCRIYRAEDKKETWLMSNFFRYVQNPDKSALLEKYIGKIKFTKIIYSNFEGESNKTWTPPEKENNGQDDEVRVPVDDIEIVVYSDSEMKIKRRYELEYGWKDEWIERKNYELDMIHEDFRIFEAKWNEAKQKMIVPGWYYFDPRYPTEINHCHNMMKKWDPDMFHFLKEMKWTDMKVFDNEAVEQSHFVIDCSQLLGIGGEAIVIKVSIEDTDSPTTHHEQRAFKIIPVHNHRLKIQEMENKFVETYLKAAEDVQTTDIDFEISENLEANFEHDSLMKYSNIRLDIIKLFGKRIFVMLIGKIKINKILGDTILSIYLWNTILDLTLTLFWS